MSLTTRPAPTPVAMQPATVRVLVVDDTAAFRVAATAVIRRTPGFVVAGEAPDGEQALRCVAALAPDLVLLDIHLPGMDGIAVCTELVRRGPQPRVLLCSTYGPTELPAAAMTCGALAYLPKDQLRPSVLRALWDAAAARLDAAATRPAGPPPG